MKRTIHRFIEMMYRDDGIAYTGPIGTIGEIYDFSMEILNAF